MRAWRTPPGVSARASSGLAASTSSRRCGGVPPHARTLPRGDATRARGGGDAFDRLVRQQGPEYTAPDCVGLDAALDHLWLSRGVREKAYRARLVAMASRDRLYGDPARLAVALDRLQSLFPDSVAAAMCWKEPDVLHLPLKHVAAQLVSLRYALPDVDVPKIVEGQPGLLLRDVGACADVVRRLRREFPSVDVARVVETEPSLLTAECDVPARLARVRDRRARGITAPSLDVFYDGGVGCRNAMLFAKVFLEESRHAGEAHESQG